MFTGLWEGAFIAGCVAGLLPFIVALRRGNERLGAIGFLVCAASSLLSGLLLALPIALITTFVIIRRTRQ